VNENDLRDCFAMFIVCGMVMKYNEVDPNTIWKMADEMLEARKPKEKSGIIAVKRSPTTRRSK
jgi:NADPH-dependent curcumin reductase CurA